MRLLEKIIKCKELPSPPIIISKLEQLYARDADRQEISELIETDSALTANVLRLANSSYYFVRNGAAETVDEAISVIGLKDLRMLVMTAAIINLMKDISLPKRVTRDIWYQGLQMFITAQNMAADEKYRNPEQVATQALLSVVGRLALWISEPDLARDVEKQAENERYLEDAEIKILGFNHGKISYNLLRSWGLPETLIAPINIYLEYVDCVHDDLNTKILQQSYIQVQKNNANNKLVKLMAQYLGVDGLIY